MKNHFKKFSIMFVMSLILVFVGAVSAFADDSYIVGTANLGNTVENSAKVGDQLIAPEKGWKRYDDSNDKIKYSGTWALDVDTNQDNKSYYTTTDFSSNSALKFGFYRKKLRI